MNWERVIATLRQRAASYNKYDVRSTSTSARVFVLEAIADALEEGWTHERD
jgi:hypothetical protein